MPDDIVTRLRDYDRHCSDFDIDEAADEIERLRLRVADLERQLAEPPRTESTIPDGGGLF